MLHLIIFLSFVVLFVPCQVFADDPIMGNWEGTYGSDGGAAGSLSAQIVAEGGGDYRAVIRVVARNGREVSFSLMGNKEGDKAIFSGRIDLGPETGAYDINGQAEASDFRGRYSGLERSGTFLMKKVHKKPPTLGAKPPEGAIVLFDGASLKHWQQLDGRPAGWKILEDGSMEVTKGNIITRQEFGDCKIHLEFRTPFMPEARGQRRGNSGVYLQGRYEVQVLDSFGLEPKDNECGGIYSVAAPRVNACLPPLEWQTYDITFHAPGFDEEGNKFKDAEMTVVHNGILIHDQVKVPAPTRGGKDKQESKLGGLMLQDHRNPVQYRNIWLVELK